MQVTKTVEETRKQIKAWKKEGKTVGRKNRWNSCLYEVDRT